MNKFKSLSKKDKAEYISIILLYPLFMLFSWLGKSLKLFGTKKRQITASVLAFAMILTMLPVMSLTAFAASASNESNTAFSAITYDDGARISLPLITGAKNYKLYVSTDDAVDDNDYLVYDGEYTAFTYAANGTKDVSETPKNVSITAATSYYFILVTNDGASDTKISFQATTEAADSSWISDESRYDISWYNDTDSEFRLSTAKQLAGFDKLHADEILFEGKTIILENDIDMSEYKWVSSFNTFYGAFDGNGHAVSGLYINNTDGHAGFIGWSQTEIKDFGLTKGFINGKDTVGSIVVHNSGTMTDCYSTCFVSGKLQVGGLAGINAALDDGEAFSGCYNEGTVVGEEHVGGIIGENYDKVEDCYNKGIVKNNGTKSEFNGTGGIAGRNHSEISNCYNAGTIIASNLNTGGIVGFNLQDNAIINECYNTGVVNGSSYVGGIAGWNADTNYVSGVYIPQTSRIKDCYNDGTVTGYRMVGGIAGNNIYEITGCYNTGSVKSSRNNEGDDDFGGIAGVSRGKVSSCYNTGTITSGASYTAGIAGAMYGKDTVIENSYNTGAVTGKRTVGGIVGASGNSGTVSKVLNCYNTGTIKGMFTVGGVVGNNFEGIVTYCYNKGAIEGTAAVGGVVALNEGTLSLCYNAQAVKGVYSGTIKSWQIGGVVGNNSSAMSLCYSTGAVTGDEKVGGVAGYCSADVINCFYLPFSTKQAGIGALNEGTDGSKPFAVLSKSEYMLKDSAKGALTASDVSALKAADAFGSKFDMSISNITPDAFNEKGTDKSISFTFSITQPNLTETGWSTEKATESKLNASISGITVTAPPITGTVTLNNASPKVGDTLTTTLSGFPSDATAQYKWYAGSSVIADATSSSYTVTSANLNKAIKVEVSSPLTHDGKIVSSATNYVVKKDQSALDFGAYSTTKTYGDSSYSLIAVGGSGTGAVSYKSSNTSVATVDASGNVTIVGVGNFTITATKAADSNYKVQTATTDEITVSPKTLTITGLTAENRNYDGTKDIAISGGTLDGKVGIDNVYVTMPTSGTMTDKNVGNGKSVTIATPTLSGSKASCYTLEDISGVTVNISPKPVTITGVTAHDKTYDGTNSARINSNGTVIDLITGDSVDVQPGTITFNSANASDTAALTATGFTLTGTDKNNYTLSAQPTVANAKIEKATLMVSVDKVTIKTGETIPALTVKITGFVNGEGESLVGFEKPTAAVNGTVDTTNTALTSFNITVSGGNATENYKFEIFPTNAEIEIQGVDIKDDDYTVTPDNTKWQNSALTVSPSGDYDQISIDKGSWKTALSLDAEGKNSSVTFYLKNSATGVTTAGKTITYKFDKTAPDGDIAFNTSPVKKFLNTISFGLLFKDNVNVEITSTDELSDVEKTEYFKSTSVLSESEVKSISDWTEYNNNFSVTATDKDKFIIYVKVTDNAGNSTYFGSDGATFDTVAPSISAENGKTYCSAVEVTVTDDNIDTVTLNDDKVTLINGKFTVSPKAGTQTIVATDKAGNKTTVIITVNNDHTPNDDDGDCTTAIHCKYCDAITTDAKAHVFGGEYIADGANGHYQECQNAGCIKHSETVSHTGEDDNNCETEFVCPDCGYVIKAAQTHDFSGAYTHDETYHWHICIHDGCTVTDTKTAHEYNINGTETPSTYFANGSRVDTCVCGATNTVVLPMLIDKTAPTATITIGENTWNSLLNSISFGLFFKDTQTVTVTANDNNESGIDKTYYYLASGEMTDFTGVSWTEFENSFNISPNNKYVVYVKVTDKVGNETIINSDGIILENIVPQISAENNKTYCAAIEVTVTDDNLDTVTLNDDKVTLADGKFTVNPADGEQTIIATDKAGNKTTVTITVNDGHTWDDGKVTTEPTAANEGVRTYTCTVCGETKTEAIDMLSPSMTEKTDKYVQGSNTGLTFKSNSPLSALDSVSVDGKELDKSNYTTKDGSTIVTLKPEYLDTLSVGTHTLDIKSVSGTASAEFTIEAKAFDSSKPTDTTKPTNPNSPQTGDSSNMILWIALLFVSGGVLGTLGLTKKRRKQSEK